MVADSFLLKRWSRQPHFSSVRRRLQLRLIHKIRLYLHLASFERHRGGTQMSADGVRDYARARATVPLSCARYAKACRSVADRLVRSGLLRQRTRTRCNPEALQSITRLATSSSTTSDSHTS